MFAVQQGSTHRNSDAIKSLLCVYDAFCGTLGFLIPKDNVTLTKLCRTLRILNCLKMVRLSARWGLQVSYLHHCH